MQQRYYDPIAGRFLSVDPVVTDAKTGSSFNRYVYSNNNPYRYKDPDGRFADLALDVAFIVADVVDIARNGLSLENGASLVGNIVGAAIPGATGLGSAAVAGVAILKGVDKAAEGGKATAATTRAENVRKGIPESQLGPSGEPKVHNVQHSTTKGAKQAAQQQTPPGGKVRNDAHPKGDQKPHFQAEDAKGDNVKPVVHHIKPD
jgi:uncharacterized protein RhaS with RHS repeats